MKLTSKRIVVLVLLLVIAGAGLAFWKRSTIVPILPPKIDNANVDPAVLKAITDCRDRVMRHLQTASDWGNLGMVLTVHDFNEEADTCFREAERLDGKEPRWPYYQGLSLIKNDPAAAILKLRRAVELAGTATSPRLRLAKALTEIGEFDEAQELYRTVAQSEPDNPWAKLGLGRVLFERGQNQESLLALEAPANNPATRKAAKTMRMSIYSQLGDKTSAKAEMADLANLPDDSAMPDPWVREMNRTMVGIKAILAQINQLLASGRGNEAAKLLVQMVEQYPKSEEAWRFAGQILLKANDLPNAEAAWRHALESSPDSVLAHYNLGVALFRQSNFAKAANSFQRAAQLKPDHGMAHFYFGKCLEQSKEYSKAIVAFREAARCQPQTVEIHVALCDALAHEGKQDEAVSAIERALSLQPNEESLKRRLAKLRQLGSFNKAE